METVAGISVAVLILTALFVAIKTFSLWHRTRAVPELLLGSYLMCATVLAYPLLIASSRISPSQMWPLHVGGQVVMSIGFTCLLFFTLKVFRAEAPLWATCFVGACLLSFTVGGVAYFREMTGQDPRPAAELLHINLANTLPIAATYFWTTIESLTYHRQLKLRHRVGLADAVIVNRVLLWGLMTLAAGAAVLISLVGMLSGAFLSTPLILVLSSLGIVHAACLFLAFHPPAWYSRSLLAEEATEGDQPSQG
jgi:hypothetical protein